MEHRRTTAIQTSEYFRLKVHRKKLQSPCDACLCSAQHLIPIACRSSRTYTYACLKIPGKAQYRTISFIAPIVLIPGLIFLKVVRSAS